MELFSFSTALYFFTFRHVVRSGQFRPDTRRWQCDDWLLRSVRVASVLATVPSFRYCELFPPVYRRSKLVYFDQTKCATSSRTPAFGDYDNHLYHRQRTTRQRHNSWVQDQFCVWLITRVFGSKYVCDQPAGLYVQSFPRNYMWVYCQLFREIISQSALKVKNGAPVPRMDSRLWLYTRSLAHWDMYIIKNVLVDHAIHPKIVSDTVLHH